jgi:hypothetical protein
MRTDRAPLPTLEGSTAFVRRHVAVLLALTLLGALVGWAVAAARPDRYVASVNVLMLGAAEQQPEVARTQTMDTLARLVWSQDVVDAVANATGVDDTDVVDRLDVGALPLSRVLVVRFTGDTAAQAAQGAEAAGEQVIRTRLDLFGRGGSIAQRAQEPAAPTRANAEVFVVSGALLGLLVAVLWAAARDGLRATNHARHEPGAASRVAAAPSTTRRDL